MVRRALPLAGCLVDAAGAATAGQPWYDYTSSSRRMQRGVTGSGWVEWTPKGVSSISETFWYHHGWGSGVYLVGQRTPGPPGVYSG